MGHEVLSRSIRAMPLLTQDPIPGHLVGVCPDQLPLHWCWKILVMHKWGLAPTSVCKCGAFDQTTAHVILKCPLYCAPRGYHGLLVLDDETRYWLNNAADI